MTVGGAVALQESVSAMLLFTASAEDFVTVSAIVAKMPSPFAKR